MRNAERDGRFRMDVWKLNRELERIKQQLRGLPEILTEPVLNRRHNAAFHAKFPVHEGEVALEQRVALYLIYQPNTVADSVVETCKHLIAKGYSPFIVSNSEMTDDALNALKPVAWRILERPNFGHDFGGYRDGIFSLKDWNVSPKYLCVLNDSVWFPLYETENLIDFCEEDEQSISGTILRDSGEKSFLESYFFVIPETVFNAPAFEQFWTDFLLTSNKYKVIKRGEKGFSRTMAKAGIALRPAFPESEFIHGLESADDDFLRKTLQYATFPDTHLQAYCAQLLERWDGTTRTEALDFIRKIMPKRMNYSAFPYAMTKICNYPLLKKSRNAVGDHWRETMLLAWNAGDLPKPSAVVKREVEQSLGK